MSSTVDLALATKPTNIHAVPQLIESINELSRGLAEGGEQSRHQLVIKTRNLMQALLTPREQMVQHIWANVCHPPYTSRSCVADLLTISPG